MASGEAMSHLSVEETAVHDIELLLAREAHEVHRVTRDADSELRIFVRIVHRIEQRLLAQDVEIHMESALAKEHVEAGDAAPDGRGFAFSVVCGDNRERVADAVLRFGCLLYTS